MWQALSCTGNAGNALEETPRGKAKTHAEAAAKAGQTIVVFVFVFRSYADKKLGQTPNL